MTAIIMKAKGAVDRNSLSSINHAKNQSALTARSISTLNRTAMPTRQTTSASAAAHRNIPMHTAAGNCTNNAGLPVQKPLPPLVRSIQKGQKTPLEPAAPLPQLQACFGWNTTNPQCDIDVSAFLLTADGRVPGDSWFVFYGQTESPDQSCRWQAQSSHSADRQIIHINFKKLNADVKKIVFVLTINDAFAKKLHFGMMKDAYVRILHTDQTEITSFKITDYYTNIISMMIGEIYLHNGKWKFNAVGNGVARDLAGLCDLYGVQVSN